MPDQGWKLHISSTILSVLDVLERALPVLLVEDAAFKVAGSARMLVELNSGMSGLSQVGKFITVYPNSDEQAVRLAGALHRATQGLRGPVVPSDRPLMPGSLVHYRYGGFLHMYMQSGQGEAQLAVRAPSGEMVLDERNVAYQSPEWASDPFIAGNIAAPLPEANPLVGGRYLPISMLAISARGTVHAAVDIVGRRRCVLKRAYRDAAMGFDGTDAWDRLRNEAAVMAHLSPDPRFPEPYGVLEQDGDLFLAMEDVEGETLYNCVRALSVQGRYVSPRQAITWGLELAGMLGAIHAKGMAYRDLKSSNVIVSPGGGLRLVDFDVTMELTAPRPLYSPGTYGYMTREQRIDEPPRVAHDVYALGALLYFIATGAEPSMFPHHFDLLRRRVADVNPQVPAPLADVIARCLEPDPARRFASMADVHAALAAIESEGSEVTGKHISPGEAGREHYREMARRLGDTMCEAVLSGLLKQGRMWATAFGSENDAGLRDISVGSAGVVLALAELVDEIGDERHREVLAEMAQDLARTHPPQNRPMPGLYVGEAGVGAALLRAGQVLGRDDLITEAVAKGRLVSGLPHTSPALFNGTAGRLRYHLLLWDETGGEEHLAAAIEAGDILLRSAEPVGEEGGLRWTIPPGYNQHSGRTYLGYSLGAAGIGDALLDLFEATVDGRFLEGARGAGRWIARNVKAALEDGSGLDWPAVEGEELEGAFWGHGASGIGRFLIHAARLDALPGAHELARRAALTAAQGTRWAGPTLGYGLCGPIEFLLDMYQWNHEETYLRDAHALARVVESFAVEREGLLVWPSESPYLVTASFMAGYSGVAHTLLRLSAPERVPHHLGRRTYKGRLLGEGGAGALP
jgi:tRNA A-37 threonylcarbamoyl transferase component Bud32